MTLDEKQARAVFEFFNEIGIINQLATSVLNRRLPEGLHVSHFSVLNHLVRLGDGTAPLALASAFQVTKGTMTHTLSALEKRGLIRFAPHETDGRSKLVFLTEEGRLFRERAINDLAPFIASMGQLLDLRKLERMLPQLAEVRRLLDDNRDI